MNPWDNDPIQPAPAAPVYFDPAAVSNAPINQRIEPAGADVGGPGQAFGYEAARSAVPATLGGIAAAFASGAVRGAGYGPVASAIGGGLAALGTAIGAREAQDYIIPRSEYEQRTVAGSPNAALAGGLITMPLGGGLPSLNAARSALYLSRVGLLGRALTEAEKAVLIQTGTTTAVNLGLSAAPRAINAARGGDFGLGDYLSKDLPVSLVMTGKSMRPVEALHDVSQTVGFKSGYRTVGARRQGAVDAGALRAVLNQPATPSDVPPVQPAGVESNQSYGEAAIAADLAAAEAEANPIPVVQPVATPSVEPVPAAPVPAPSIPMPANANPRVWAGLTNEGRIAYAADLAATARMEAALANPPTQTPEPSTPAPEKPSQKPASRERVVATTERVEPVPENNPDAATEWRRKYGKTHFADGTPKTQEQIDYFEALYARIDEQNAQAQKPAPAVEAPKPTTQAVEAPKPAPVQTEIPGAQDAFNLTGQEAAPAPAQQPAATQPDLVAPTEPAYVSQARKALADLVSAGKGDSAEAAGLRALIDSGSKPTAPAAPKPAAPAPAAEQPAPAKPEVPATARLPRDLAGSKPRYAYGDKNFETAFESDLDKAAFIASQGTKNKRHDDFVKWATETFGMTEAELAAHGQKVRQRIKEMARDAEGGTPQKPAKLEIPTVERAVAAKPVEAPAPVAPKPEAAAPKPAAPAAPAEPTPVEAPAPATEPVSSRSNAVPAGYDETIASVESLSGKRLSSAAKSELGILAEEGLQPDFVDEAGINNLRDHLNDVNERIDGAIESAKDASRSEPEAAAKSRKALNEAKKAVEAAIEKLDANAEPTAPAPEPSKPVVQPVQQAEQPAKPLTPEEVAAANREAAKKAAAERRAEGNAAEARDLGKTYAEKNPAPEGVTGEAAEPVPEPVEVTRARQEAVAELGKPRPNRAKVDNAKAIIDQYEADMDFASGKTIDAQRRAMVSDEALQLEIDKTEAMIAEYGPLEGAAKERHEANVKELVRRLELDNQEATYDQNSDSELVRSLVAAVAKHGKIPRLYPEFGASQLESLYQNMPEQLRRKLFAYERGLNRARAKTDLQYRQDVVARAEGKVENLVMVATQNNPAFDLSTHNRGDYLSAVTDAANNESQVRVRPGGSVRRLYTVDPIDQAHNDFTQGSETNNGLEMPPSMDDGNGGASLNVDANGEGGWAARLDDAADRLTDPNSGTMRSAGPDVWAALVWKTARAMQRGVVNVAKGFKTWSADMISKYGDPIKSQLESIWASAYGLYSKGFVNLKPHFIAGIAEKAWQKADNAKSAAARQLAGLIFQRPGRNAEASDLGIPRQIELEHNQVDNRLGELVARYKNAFGKLSKAERENVNRVLQNAHEGRIPMPDGWVGDLVRAMREEMRNNPQGGYNRQIKAGIKMGDQGENYFPHRMDMVKVKADEAGFKAVAAKAYRMLYDRHNAAKRLELFPDLPENATQPMLDTYFQAQAEAYYNRIVERITDGDISGIFGPNIGAKPAKSTAKRTFNMDESAVLEKYQINDYIGTIQSYLRQGSRRAILAERLGPDGEILNDISRRMAAEGVDSDTRNRLRELLQKAIGVGAKPAGDAERLFFDMNGLLQATAMLDKSFINNLMVEPGAIGSRAARMGYDLPLTQLRAYLDTATNLGKDAVRLNKAEAAAYIDAFGKSPSFAVDLDRAISEEFGLNGIDDPSFYVETSGDLANDGPVSVIRRTTNAAHSVNLLGPSEAAKVTASVSAARRFILGNARAVMGKGAIREALAKHGINIGGEKAAAKFLAELGVAEKDFGAFHAFAEKVEAARRSGDNKLYIDLISDHSDPMALLYRKAVQTFSGQSSPKPSRATKIEEQDTVFGKLYMNLKGFNYDFSQSVNARRLSLAREALTGKNYGKVDRLAMAAPLIGGVTTVAAVLMKYALYNWLYHSAGTERRDKMPALAKVFDAASYEGLFGPGVDAAVKSFMRQQTPIGGAVGQMAVDTGKAALSSAKDDSTSNAPERRLAQVAWRNVGKPVINTAALTMLPKPIAAGVMLGTGLGATEKAVVDTAAGPEGEGKKPSLPSSRSRRPGK